MKYAKRLICLLIVAVMSIGIVACGTDSGNGDQAAPPANGDAAPPADGGTAPPAGEDTRPRVTITYACPQVIEGFNYHADCEYSIWILDKFNIQFEPTNLPWGEWHALLSMWIMAQDAPDVAIFNYNDGTHADAANFVEQGLIKRLPDDWKARWPGVAAVFETTHLGPMLEDLFGGTYFLPRARFFHNIPGDPLANHWSLWMRNDWVEAVGFEVRNHYTIPEVLEIARRIQAEDPGNVGAALIPISMTYANAAIFFLRANSTYWDSFYRDGTGQYVWGAASDETLEGLLYWFDAFDEGLLHPEFFVLTHEQDMEHFQTMGIAGVSYLGGQTADVENFRIDFNRDTGMPREAFGLATLLGADGHYHQRCLVNYWGAVFFNPNVDTAVFERWMDLMEFTASREGYPGTQIGIPGVHWDFDAAGEIISLVPPGTQLAGPVGIGQLPSLGHVLGSIILWDDLAFDNPNIGAAYREESRALYANRSQFGTPDTFVNVDWTIWLQDTDAMRRASDVNRNIPQEFATLITMANSREHLTELYNNWISSQMGMIQPALDELNALP